MTSTCPGCGHRRSEGRFCTHCGLEVTPERSAAAVPATSAWRTDTAERLPPPPPTGLYVDPRTPPSAVAPPPPPRFPLYADEVADGLTRYDGPGAAVRADEPAGPADPVEQPTDWWSAAAAPPPDPGFAASGEPEWYDEDRRGPWLWILIVVLVLALVAAGWWFLVAGSGPGVRSAGSDASDGGSAAAGSDAVAAGDPVEVSTTATASAPRTAAPNQDVRGERTTYDAANMLDGKPETAWRVAGSAAGMELTFTLAAPAQLTRVGMLNGYAKTSSDARGRTFDWYAGNRRVTSAVWLLGDGTRVRQRLAEDTQVQSIDIDPVTTDTVVLRLVTVSAPGTGRAGRDFTAISEVSLVGVPTGG